MTGREVRHRDPREHLATELSYLRSLVREAGDAFILKTEGRIEAIVDALGGMDLEPVRDDVASWLRKLRRVNFKPSRGRIKDLRRMDLLVDLLEEVLQQGESDDPSPRRRRGSSPGVTGNGENRP